MSLSLRGETPFPQGGDGVVLKFRNTALAMLQDKFGDDYFTAALTRCDRLDAKYIFECIRLGAMKDGKPFGVTIDKIDTPLKDLAAMVLDALYVSMFGMTFKERADEWEAARRKGESPLAEASSPETSSAS